MESYLISSDDWRLVEERPDVLCQQFERFLNIEALYISPVLFAEYSCLTQFVDEEIDLVVSNQERCNKARLNRRDFIEFWNWKDKLSTKVSHLSGGWRKLLSLCLFVNQDCENVLVVDFATHLSDGSISFFLQRMMDLQIKRAGFVEYDCELLARQLPNATRLRQSGLRVWKDN